MDERLSFAESMRADRRLQLELLKSFQEAQRHIKDSEALIAESKALLAGFSSCTSLPTIATTS